VRRGSADGGGAAPHGHAMVLMRESGSTGRHERAPMRADLLKLRLEDVAVTKRQAKNTRLGELLRVAPVVAAIHSLVSISEQRDKVR